MNLSKGNSPTLSPNTAAWERDYAELRMKTETLETELDYLCRALEKRRVEIASLAAERSALENDLQSLMRSRIWRAGALIRKHLQQMPIDRQVRFYPANLIRKVFSFLHSFRSRKGRARDNRNPASSASDTDCVLTANGSEEHALGWYGSTPLTAHEISRVDQAVSFDPDTHARQTRDIIHRYGHMKIPDGSEMVYRLAEMPELAHSHLEASTVSQDILASKTPGHYSIVTPFYKHAEFFTACGASIAGLIQGNKERIEWIVVNDDPHISEETLIRLTPESVRDRIRIVSDGQNRGIVARLHQGITLSRNPWILFLDCDDELEPVTLEILDHYIGLFPYCRYISSTMTDIAEDGKVLRLRYHEHPATELFKHGMVASHLKAIRRDLIEELNGFDPSLSGVQDYDFALRAAAREPLLQIPERLYRYRWHKSSQTVAQQEQQAFLARAARARFLKKLLP